MSTGNEVPGKAVWPLQPLSYWLAADAHLSVFGSHLAPPVCQPQHLCTVSGCKVLSCSCGANLEVGIASAKLIVPKMDFCMLQGHKRRLYGRITLSCVIGGVCFRTRL